MKKLLKWIGIVFVGLIILVIVMPSSENDLVERMSTPKSDIVVEKSDPIQTKTVEKAKSDVPREHQSALKKAESYSKTMYMSKAGVYDPAPTSKSF